MYVGTHEHSFRRNEIAELLEPVFVHSGNTPILCYHIKFKDGKEDYVPICDKENYTLLFNIKDIIEVEI